MNPKPYFNGGVFLRRAPAVRQFSGQAMGKRIQGVDPPISLLACHLRNEMIGWLALGFGPKGVMNAQQMSPVDGFRRPAFNALEILGTMSKLVGPPGQQEYVLHRSQPQHR